MTYERQFKARKFLRSISKVKPIDKRRRATPHFYPSTTPGAESTLDSVVSRLIFVSIIDVTPVPRKLPVTGPAKRGVADAAAAM